MLFRPILERLQALFATLIASRFETEVLLTFSGQKTELLREAQRLDREGYPEVAADLRQRAEQMSLENPAATAMPVLALLAKASPRDDVPPRAALPSADDSDGPDAPTAVSRGRRRPQRSA